jgi:four helix bundle protein
MKTHKDLEVWKRAVDFVTTIYEVTASFPKFEQYGLAIQLRRAAVSIASNIAEGAARQSTKEFIQFLHCSLGSASEVETQLIVACNLEYIENKKAQSLISVQGELSRMIMGLIKSLKRNKQG